MSYLIYRRPIQYALTNNLLRSLITSGRHYSAATASTIQPHQYPSFQRLSATLSLNQPCFGARGDEVELLNEPSLFYQRLIEMISRAKRRILISTLYIGAEEGELLESIKAALTNNPQLRVMFILDYHRATRLAPHPNIPPSTAHLLLPLVERFPERCEVWLFRSPKLKGIMEKIVPTRYDEAWGTWHGKWYGVDDEVIISGANLAHSYFTNRQDRYIHFKSNPGLLSYLSSLTRLFTQYSYLLNHSTPPHISPYNIIPLPSPDDQASAPAIATNRSRASLIWSSPSLHQRGFVPHALATLTAFQNSWRASNVSRSRRVDIDTWFWPVLQAGVLGIREEEKAMEEVWKAVTGCYQNEEGNEQVEVDLTSGYFGLYRRYRQAIIESPAPVNIIAASPKANGFYGSNGFSRLIPEGYTLLESRFRQNTIKAGRQWDAEKGVGVRLKEWERDGWTYHSKGLWVSPPSNKPFLTFAGSSNLSTRSLTLDTELSMVMMTSSPVLRRALQKEIQNLHTYAVDVGEETWKLKERKVSWLAWVLTALGVEKML
ncbi:uncharacterized protein L203_105522 [Cryptococcus depauperatus CBS 7841]|uniref:CDP-diacylglycerol--glycerol-3-phosphate 3-phosphatidyltransferase n=1 Tax=Cryptococcus depauperatus CBS 7841 TaxID=1295531 RepID=A0A1E3ID63_9TREE|nr:CDP-diacylglycerol-glycerol-3-phosphate 3-phosphatidyltransferase [Cryptococcus depauperatus CBS 7841]